MPDDELIREAVGLLAAGERGTLASQALVDWATRALAAGHEGPALVTLAGMDLDTDPILRDVMPLFHAALEQLGLPVPSGTEAILRAHLQELARQISIGLLTPGDGVARVEREVMAPLEHPADLMSWCYLDSNLHPETFRELSDRDRDAYVLMLARRVLESV